MGDDSNRTPPDKQFLDDSLFIERGLLPDSIHLLVEISW